MFMVQYMDVHLNAAPPKYFSYIDVLLIPSNYYSIRRKMLFYIISMKPDRGTADGGTVVKVLSTNRKVASSIQEGVIGLFL
jgi:hypothetical protein